MKNKVDVVIANRVTTLITDESPEHVHKLARYVDKKIETLGQQNRTAVLDERLRTLFIALNLADDYFKAKESADQLTVDTEKLTTKVAKLEKENASLKEKLATATGELEAFIQNFDANTEKTEKSK